MPCARAHDPAGQITLRDMNFGQVRSLAFRKDVSLGTSRTDLVKIVGAVHFTHNTSTGNAKARPQKIGLTPF